MQVDLAALIPLFSHTLACDGEFHFISVGIFSGNFKVSLYIDHLSKATAEISVYRTT